MMDFSSDIAIFFDPDSPGIEAITYIEQGKDPRTIYGYVTRGPLDVTDRGGRPLMQDQVEIEIAHHATLGVLLPKSGLDMVIIAEHVDGPEKTYKVSMITKEDQISKVIKCGS